LKEFRVNSILQLGCITPKEYNFNFLDEFAINGKINTLFVTILRHEFFAGKHLNVYFYINTSGEAIKGTIFNFTKYHLSYFRTGKEIYITGMVQEDKFGTTILQPKITKKPTEEIILKYRHQSLTSAKVREIIEKYVTFDNFKNQGLPEKVILDILKIHLLDIFQNNTNFSDIFKNSKDFHDELTSSLKYCEMFNHIKILMTKKVISPSLKKLNSDYKPWIESLPFKLTNDQKNVIADISRDLNRDEATRRMIVGDVGSGKTMVILASIIIAQPHRAVLMAPTSLLAEQLFEEAKKFLPDDLNIALVTSKTAKKIGDVNFYDVLVGTHALLFQNLKNIPLIIVDEQHRFGTIHRKKLEKLLSDDKKKPHFLQFSATPIPRTQAMINSAFIDISLIKEIPFKKNIKSSVIKSRDFNNLISHIKTEIENNHQVLIIYPLVQESDNFNYQSLEESRDYWFNNFENVYLTHGKDKNKDEVLKNFRENGDILLSTTVVEVGISLPRLTIIVIVGAERLGLATLHQLRGRVSRTGLDGFCYLFTKSYESKAMSRLKEFAETPSGFDIATLDLKNRKGGDLVSGVKQSGNAFKWIDLADDEEIIDEVKKYISQQKEQLENEDES
jgi:ATP-dependent DNA helicase RecG